MIGWQNTINMPAWHHHAHVLFLVLLFCTKSCVLACNSDEFYTPKTCLRWGVVSTFECRTCPTNAVQYAKADETCVCKMGYYATGAKYMCDDYLGNGGATSRVWPAVEVSLNSFAFGFAFYAEVLIMIADKLELLPSC